MPRKLPSEFKVDVDRVARRDDVEGIHNFNADEFDSLALKYLGGWINNRDPLRGTRISTSLAKVFLRRIASISTARLTSKKSKKSARGRDGCRRVGSGQAGNRGVAPDTLISDAIEFSDSTG